MVHILRSEIRRSIFDKPVLCLNKGIWKKNLTWQEPFVLVSRFNRKMSFHFPQAFPLISDCPFGIMAPPLTLFVGVSYKEWSVWLTSLLCTFSVVTAITRSQENDSKQIIHALHMYALRTYFWSEKTSPISMVENLNQQLRNYAGFFFYLRSEISKSYRWLRNEVRNRRKFTQ